jgi:hypothetical protein
MSGKITFLPYTTSLLQGRASIFTGNLALLNKNGGDGNGCLVL